MKISLKPKSAFGRQLRHLRAAAGRAVPTQKAHSLPMTDRLDPTSKDARALQDALMRAHASGAVRELVALYAQAGQKALAAGDTDAGAFFLTHARVFALESGDPREAEIFSVLKALGRER